MLGKILIGAYSLLSLVSPSVKADCLSKLDIGIAYAHVDILDEHKETAKELDIIAIRAELDYITDNGWYVKPIATYGEEKDGELFQASIAFGRYLPIFERVCVAPLIGVSYSKLNATIHRDFGPYGITKTRNRFRSWAPFVATEVTIKICQDLRLSILAQYAWSFTRSVIKDFDKFNSDSRGPNVGAMLEYDINKCWSANIGYGFNESLSKAKSGLRVHALKIGVGKWF